jgi:hypothetical protein
MRSTPQMADNGVNLMLQAAILIIKIDLGISNAEGAGNT